MSEETRIQLTLETGGSVPAVAKLRQEIEQLKDVLQKQAQAYADGELPLEVFIRGNQAARTVIGQLEGALVSITPKIAEVAGSDIADTGFASVASNVIKAEKAFGALAGMGGLGRVGPMLESVLLSLGGPAGMGLAIGAVALAAEKYGPQIAKFFDLFDAEKIKAAEEQLKKLTDEIDKVQGKPSKAEKESSEQVKEFFGGQDVRGDIASALELTGRGARATPEELAGLDLRTILGTTGLGGAQGVEEQERRKQAIRERIQKENVRLASEMMDRAMQAGKGQERGLAEVAGLAEQAPESFAPGFGRNLQMFGPAAVKERGEADRVEHEANKEADEWAKRRKEGIKIGHDLVSDEAKHNREMEHQKAQLKAKRHRVEAAQHKEDAAIIHEANEDDREEDREAKHAEHQRKQAETKAAHDARENMPEARNRREQAEEKNEAMGLVQQNTFGFTPSQQAMIARHLQGNHQAGLDMSVTFEQALAYAIQQTKIDIQRGIQAGMNRHQVMSEVP